MATLVLLHNPRCSKSREALALLEEAGIEAQVRRYLDDPLNGQELRELIARLDGSPRDLVRTNETEWKTLGADRDDRNRLLRRFRLIRVSSNGRFSMTDSVP